MHFETTADIDAPAEKVWEILADVRRWPEWTDSIDQVDLITPGDFAVGSKAKVRQPRLPTAVWTVTELTLGSNFTWTAGNPGILTTAAHILRPRDGGVTLLLTLDQTGPLSPVIGRLTAGLTRRYMEMEASGLKARAEV